MNLEDKQNKLMISVTVILLFLIAFTGCSSEEDLLWAYKPMISMGDDLFGESGHTKHKLADKWELVGIIEQEVSQTEPMVKGESYYIANYLPEGTKIFGNEEEPEVIYAKHNGTFIRYELMDE